MWLQTIPGAPTTNVARLLTNPRLVGHNIYLGERVEASTIAPILDEDTFDDLVRMLTDPARRTSGLPKGKVCKLLTEIAMGGICNDGSTMTSKAGKPELLYGCKTRSHNQHKRAAADEKVSRATVRLLTGPEAPEVMERHSETPESVREELRDLRTQLDSWQSLGADLGPVEYMRVTKPLRERVAALEEVSRQTSHRALFEGLNFLSQSAPIWGRYEE